MWSPDRAFAGRHTGLPYNPSGGLCYDGFFIMRISADLRVRADCNVIQVGEHIGSPLLFC